MSYTRISSELFTFSSSSSPDLKFYVINFKGREALNEAFYFKINLACRDTVLDIHQLIGSPAVFSIRRKSGKNSAFSGAIMSIMQTGCSHGYIFYTIELRSQFYKATQCVYSLVYLDQSVNETLDLILAGENFYSLPREFRLSGKYPKIEFGLQYNENFYDYIRCQIERNGMYFFFSPEDDKIIFADSPNSHDPSVGTVHYLPERNLDFILNQEIIHSFSFFQTYFPNKVIIRSYDWKNPNHPIVGTHLVSENPNLKTFDSYGDIFLSNEEAATQEEADRIAKIRAEQIFIQHHTYSGESNVPFFRAGVVFTLADHYNNALNRDYMITEVNHEGSQEAFLNLKMQLLQKNKEPALYYKNSFSCIESSLAYRPPLSAKRACIHGFIHAFIDGSVSDNNVPTMDNYGRYKVILPFDSFHQGEGKASCWIRRAQEQVGKDFGMAFPLYPGTEVLISFKDGNPDLPVITGSLPNGESGSISGETNSKIFGIRTEGGTQLTFDNQTNAMSLSNTSGSGLTLTSNSSSSTVLTKTDIGLSTASACLTNLSGLLQSNISGYRVQNVTSSSPKLLLPIALIQTLLSIPNSILSAKAANAAENGEEEAVEKYTSKLAYVGLAASVLEGLAAFSPMFEIDNDNYQAVLTANKEEAANLIQSFPTKKELVANIIPIIVARGFAAGVTGRSTKKEVENYKKSKSDSPESYKQLLTACMKALYDAEQCDNYKDFWFYTVNSEGKEIKKKGKVYSLSETSPCACYIDTLSAIQTTIFKLQILIDTPSLPKTEIDKWKIQINQFRTYSAALPAEYAEHCQGKQTKSEFADFAKKKLKRNVRITQFTELLPELFSLIAFILWYLKMKKKKIGGIFINSEDKNINLHAKSYIAHHAERGIYFNTVQAEINFSAEWGLPNPHSSEITTADPLLSDIFSKISMEKICTSAGNTSTIKDEIDKGHKNYAATNDIGEKIEDPTEKNNTFIAGQTHIYFMKSQDAFAYSEDKNVSIAGLHWIKSKNQKTFLRLSDKDYALLESPCIMLTCRKERSNAFIHTMNTAYVFLGKLPPQKEALCSGLFISDNITFINGPDENADVKLSLLSDGAILSAGAKDASSDSAIALTKKEIIIKSKKTIIGGLTVQNSKITEALNGIMELGNNAIKITNMKTSSDENLINIDKKTQELREKYQKVLLHDRTEIAGDDEELSLEDYDIFVQPQNNNP